MWLVAGLGNPGAVHAANRHSIGFMAADEIVRRHGFGPWRTKHRGEMAEGAVDGVRVLVLKPMTFMNRSGLSVGDAAHFYRIPVERVLVLHDELELPAGKIRVKQGGGHAGHNGVRDVEACLGNPFWRVRLGIGRPSDKARVHEWVLSDFAKTDRLWREPLLEAVAENLGLLFDGQASPFMNEVLRATAPPSAAQSPLL